MKSLLKFLSIGLLTASLASCVSPQPEVPPTPLPSEDSVTSMAPIESTDSATSTSPIESTTEPTPEPAPAVLTLDFSTITESLFYNTESMNAAWGSEALTISDVSSVAAGAGMGGCHADELGLIKMGTGKKEGTFTVTTAEPFAKVAVSCHGFYALSNKPNANKLDVNGTTVDAPFNETGAAEVLDFTPAEPTKTWTFTSKLRVYIWSITWSN